MSTIPWNIYTPLVSFFFHVLYDNAMTFDFDLKYAWSADPEDLDVVANRTSRLGGECEISGSERANAEEV
jgi:hypothetical protein